MPLLSSELRNSILYKIASGRPMDAEGYIRDRGNDNYVVGNPSLNKLPSFFPFETGPHTVEFQTHGGGFPSLIPFSKDGILQTPMGFDNSNPQFILGRYNFPSYKPYGLGKIKGSIDELSKRDIHKVISYACNHESTLPPEFYDKLFGGKLNEVLSVPGEHYGLWVNPISSRFIKSFPKEDQAEIGQLHRYIKEHHKGFFGQDTTSWKDKGEYIPPLDHIINTIEAHPITAGLLGAGGVTGTLAAMHKRFKGTKKNEK